MILPDLSAYRKVIEEKGGSLPLKSTPNHKEGLLTILPSPADPLKNGWPWTEECNPKLYDSNVEWPKITIVTPSYNQASYLEQTIRSVLLQNYPNLEYIIMDGGSNDGSYEILEKYAPWLSYWTSEKDDGQGHAINKGFSIASGDYFAWINSDDYYLPSTFRKVIATFLRTKVDFVYGYGFNYSVYTQKFELYKVFPVLDYFIKIPSLIQPSCFWSTSIHKPIWEELHCSLDYELWIRLLKGKRRFLLQEPLSVANIHEDAKTSDPKLAAKWKEDEQKIWSEDGHGQILEWKKLVFLNNLKNRLLKYFY